MSEKFTLVQPVEAVVGDRTERVVNDVPARCSKRDPS